MKKQVAVIGIIAENSRHIIERERIPYHKKHANIKSAYPSVQADE